MEFFLLKSLTIIQSLKFTPLVLIGLMITSLSLVLNLKDANSYIFRFKKHKNIKEFVKNIYRTIVLLVFVFLFSLIANYIKVLEECILSQSEIIILSILSLVFYLSLFFIVRYILLISFIIKEIVLTSLHQD